MYSRVKNYGLTIGIAVIVFLVTVYFLELREEETAQAYQTHRDYPTSTPTVRVSVFESNLSTLQKSGGGEAIFHGGKGYVRFRVGEDDSIAVLVPVSASVPRVLPVTLARFFVADNHKFHHIRLTHDERQRLEEMEPLQDAVERKVSYSGTAPHIFIEAELGSDVVRASEMTETILTEVFQIGSGKLGTYAGDYRKFRWW